MGSEGSRPCLEAGVRDEFFVSGPAPGLVVVDNSTRNQLVRSVLEINLLARKHEMIAGLARA